MKIVRLSLVTKLGHIFLAVFAINYVQAADFYVAQNGQSPNHPYTTWMKAASNIQDAVNAAGTNDTVWVGSGRYTVPTNSVNHVGTNVVYINKPIILRSSNGAPDSTVIDGEGNNRGIAVVHTVSTSNRFVINGFTVSNCYATNHGGGITFAAHLTDSAWTGEVYNCIISDNTVAWGTNSGTHSEEYGARGGGIGVNRTIAGFGVIISNCIIRANRALSLSAPAYTGSGGGFYLRGAGQRLIISCTIESNISDSGGGGTVAKNATMQNCIFRNNNATSLETGGGGLYLNTGIHVLQNCLFYNNASAYRGGGIFEVYGKIEIYNSTVASNRAAADGGSAIGLRFVNQGAGLRMANAIIYSNANDNFYMDLSTNSFFTNSCLSSTNGLLGTGNLTNNPVFTDCALHNYRPSRGSPCINSGITLFGPAAATTWITARAWIIFPA